MSERVTHHEFLAAAGAGNLDACAAPVRELPILLEPLAWGWLGTAHLAVCDECDVAIEVWERPGPLLTLRECYPYRKNIRVGPKRRRP